VTDEPRAPTPDDPKILSCPDCGATASEAGEAWTPFTLGTHRSRKHGYRSPKRDRKAAAPRARAPRAPRDRAPRGPAAPKEPNLGREIRDGISGIGKTTGAVLGLIDPHCGEVLKTRMGPFGAALAELAEKDPRLARWLGWAANAGPYAVLFVAAADVARPIMAHHGLANPKHLLEGFDVANDGDDNAAALVGGALGDALMAAGRARHDLGADGLGQDHASA